MSGAAEGTAKRGSRWITPRDGPLYDSHLMSEFRQSHPVDAAIDSVMPSAVKIFDG
ncbi:hypothetical protein OROMI_028626 [Orobanche minor]